MRVSSRPRRNVWLLACAIVPLLPGWAAAQEPEQPLRYGREAREETPVLQRDPAKPLSEREKIHHVLSRLTFGATPEAIAEVEAVGLRQWLKTQLEAEEEEPARPRDRRAKSAPAAAGDKAGAKEPSQRSSAGSKIPRVSPPARPRRPRDIPIDELKDTVLLSAVYSDRQFEEVMFDFWRNHFNVDISKENVRNYAGEYESDVIRAEAFGTFERMLNKSARHPAMLVYLDNHVSRAAPRQELIKAGQEAFVQSGNYDMAMEAVDIARMRGINENYARELMELHTLGVDNYYTQDDVITVAHALTGWTIRRALNEPAQFQFRADMHSSEPRMFLRQGIPAHPENPELEGQAILDVLARHKGTSEFIAYKLCRHLVDDRPSPALVKRVASKFRRSRGDLRAVYSLIVNDKEFYNPKYYQSKFKRPFEYVASALRVTHAEIKSTDGIHRTLVLMSEPTYQCEDPTGYYDQADAWRDPGVMAVRWQFGLGLATGQINGVSIPASYWEGLEPGKPEQWKEVLTARILPGGCTEKTSQALDKVMAKLSGNRANPQDQGRYIVGVLLGSPEFQRQ